MIKFDDPRLIDYLKTNFLVYPPKNHRHHKNSTITYFSQIGQDKYIDKLLNKTQNGFFIEAGAYDGQKLSNTLFFERERNWTGLLIEANPILFNKLQSRNRNAYLSKACLSTSAYAVEVNFTFADYLSGQSQSVHRSKSILTGMGVVQCFPLMTYLLALNVYHVNYFSLDVEGTELDILKQIDLNRIQIDVFTIEYRINRHNSPESLKKIRQINKLLVGSGLYRQVTILANLDIVFMRTKL